MCQSKRTDASAAPAEERRLQERDSTTRTERVEGVRLNVVYAVTSVLGAKRARRASTFNNQVMYGSGAGEGAVGRHRRGLRAASAVAPGPGWRQRDATGVTACPGWACFWAAFVRLRGHIHLTVVRFCCGASGALHHMHVLALVVRFQLILARGLPVGFLELRPVEGSDPPADQRLRSRLDQPRDHDARPRYPGPRFSKGRRPQGGSPAARPTLRSTPGAWSGAWPGAPPLPHSDRHRLHVTPHSPPARPHALAAYPTAQITSQGPSIETRLAGLHGNRSTEHRPALQPPREVAECPPDSHGHPISNTASSR